MPEWLKIALGVIALIAISTSPALLYEWSRLKQSQTTQSQRTPTERRPADTSNHYKEAENQAYEAPPTISAPTIDKLPSPNLQQYAKQDRGRHLSNEDDSMNGILPAWVTVIVTIGLLIVAVVQARIYRYQARIMRSQVNIAVIAARASRISADAAKTAADAATANVVATEATVRVMRNAERPYLTIFDPELRYFSDLIQGIAVGAVLEIHGDIENIGKGAAFIDSYHIAHEICAKGTQGAKQLSVRSDFGRLVISGNTKLRHGAPLEPIRQLEANEIEMIMRGRIRIFFYGYIRYFDIFRIARRTGFMFEYAPNAFRVDESCFVMCPNRDWWYDVEEDAPQAD